MFYDLALLCICLQFIVFGPFQFNVKWYLFEINFATQGIRHPKGATQVRLDLLNEQGGRSQRERLLVLTCSLVHFPYLLIQKNCTCTVSDAS